MDETRTWRTELADSEVFRDHFPGNPIAPGSLLIELVLQQLEEFYDYPLQLASAKFLYPVEPGSVLDSTSRIEGKKIHFQVNVAGKCCVKGVLLREDMAIDSGQDK